MNKILRNTMAAALLGCLGLPGLAAAKTITIGVDLSGSNPLLTHENFAYGAAEYVSGKISGLRNGDTVRLSTFGARDDAMNLISNEFTISRRMRTGKVSAAISQFIRSLPERESAGQNATNLVAWLEFTGGFDCAGGGQIVVLTDALESSTLVNTEDAAAGKAWLPKAEVDLKGCNLTFYGLGAGFPPEVVKFLRGEWQQWSAEAGAEFNAVIR